MSKSIAVKFLGNAVSYRKAMEVQSYLLQMRTKKCISDPANIDILLLLEHVPTFTAGRRIKGTDDTEGARLRNLNAEYFQTLRGGQTTFHGPGQLVGYPILNLKTMKIGVRCYVDRLEKVLIDACSHYNIKAGTTHDTGVWVDNRKIAALGIHVSHHISTHGFALNCNTDLKWFDHIVPCGLPDKKMTSISQELMSRGRKEIVTVDTVMPVVIESFGKLFEANMSPLYQVLPEVDDHITAILM